MKNFRKQFGGSVTAELKNQYQQSDRWIKGKFRNLEMTKLHIKASMIPGMIYKQLATKKSRSPRNPLPIIPFDKQHFLRASDQAKMIWYGHSAIMLRMSNKTILIDSMLGPDTAPIAPFSNSRFSRNTLSLIDDFPEIDLICITHDHYDHLDLDSITKLKTKTKQFFVALGVKRHLVAWGVDSNIITEFEWYDEHHCGKVKITFTPTRHFSGRGLRDRAMTLWGGWLLQSSSEKIWFSGDGGYGEHFKEIGKRLGPFDFAFMECGQYNEDWRPVHLFPNESVQAAIDVAAKKIMPVHWCGFDLSYYHSWNEPPEEFVKSAKAQNVDYALPRLGEIFTTDDVGSYKWWSEFV